MNDFNIFRKEVEKDGVKIISMGEVKDPRPNFCGSYNLDYDLVVPFPAGRITEIYGWEGTRKTTLLLEIFGQAILNDRMCLYVNMERNLNLSLMKTIRPLRPFLKQAIENFEAQAKNLKLPHPECKFWIANADNGEAALETMRKFANMFPNSVVGLDSIDAAQPEAVLAGEIGDKNMGKHAQLMADAMHKLIPVAETNDVALIFINQFRQKMTMYGSPDITPGGFAIKFYASQRIELKKPSKTDLINDDDGQVIGANIRYRIAKNKSAPDGIDGEFSVLLKNGIFREKELISKCLSFGILKFGGRGGKQVLLPELKDGKETGEFITLKQFDAARRLILDQELFNHLDKLYHNTIIPNKHYVDEFIDEIQNPK